MFCCDGILTKVMASKNHYPKDSEWTLCFDMLQMICDFEIFNPANTCRIPRVWRVDFHVIKLLSLCVINRVNFFSVEKDGIFVNTSTFVSLVNLHIVFYIILGDNHMFIICIAIHCCGYWKLHQWLQTRIKKKICPFRFGMNTSSSWGWNEEIKYKWGLNDVSIFIKSKKISRLKSQHKDKHKLRVKMKFAKHIEPRPEFSVYF